MISHFVYSLKPPKHWAVFYFTFLVLRRNTNSPPNISIPRPTNKLLSNTLSPVLGSDSFGCVFTLLEVLSCVFTFSAFGLLACVCAFSFTVLLLLSSVVAVLSVELLSSFVSAELSGAGVTSVSSFFHKHT